MAKPQIQVITAEKVKFVYSDKGTRADQDVSVFEADLDYIPDGYFMVGQIAVPEHQSTIPTSALVLVKAVNAGSDVFKPPVAYELKWDDKDSGGDYDGAFWRVIAPKGYVALGDAVTRGYSQPTIQWSNKYACIKEDLISHGAGDNVAIWTDKGSGATKSGSLWLVTNGDPSPSNGLAGFFKVNDGYSKPNIPFQVLPAQVIST